VCVCVRLCGRVCIVCVGMSTSTYARVPNQLHMFVCVYTCVCPP
jgi:hypothetical protein